MPIIQEMVSRCWQMLYQHVVWIMGQGQPGMSSEAAAAAGAGDADGRLGRCLLDYNPMEKEEYEEVVATWLASLLVLAQHLAQHPAATSATAEAEQDQLPLPPTPPSKQELAACVKNFAFID